MRGETGIRNKYGEFPHGPVVRTWDIHCPGLGSILGLGIKIPQATWCGPKKNVIKIEKEIKS